MSNLKQSDSAPSPQRGLLRAQSFPVVITDWQMLRMDGIRLTESLRGQGDNDTYIIMLTVLDDGTSREAEAGVRVALLPTSPQRRHEGG